MYEIRLLPWKNEFEVKKKKVNSLWNYNFLVACAISANAVPCGPQGSLSVASNTCSHMFIKHYHKLEMNKTDYEETVKQTDTTTH